MATGREHSDEDRYELVSEARTVADAANPSSGGPGPGAPGSTGPGGTAGIPVRAPGPFRPHGTSADPVLASLAARADVDAIAASGRHSGLKRTILRVSQVFLRDQAAFNRLTVTALEDLTARMDALEAERRSGDEPRS